MTVTGDVDIYSEWAHNGNDGHVYGEPVWIEPTCEEQGYYKHECTICGEWYGTDYVPAVGHTYGKQTIAPTCTEEGYDLCTCACGASYRENYTAATGHAFGEWIVDVAATCTGKGERHRVCSDCLYCEREVVLAHGHEYNGTVTKAATCTAKPIKSCSTKIARKARKSSVKRN